MKWNAILMRFPNGGGVEGIPKDWQPPCIGTSAEVKAALEAALPDGRHADGRSTVKGDSFWVQFSYGAPEASSEAVRAIGIESDADLGSVPILKRVSEKLDCRLLDLQTGQFADFAEHTEASMNEFVQLRRRMKQERRWAFGGTVVAVVTLHALQDSGTIPAVESLSKSAVGVSGFVGLVFLNALAFFSSIISAIAQLRRVEDMGTPPEENERMEEAILVPAFRGERTPPPLIARFLHIPVAGLFGMIVGSILAWILSLLFL
jgi:hypothetical protein